MEVHLLWLWRLVEVRAEDTDEDPGVVGDGCRTEVEDLHPLLQLKLATHTVEEEPILCIQLRPQLRRGWDESPERDDGFKDFSSWYAVLLPFRTSPFGELLIFDQGVDIFLEVRQRMIPDSQCCKILPWDMAEYYFDMDASPAKLCLWCYLHPHI